MGPRISNSTETLARRSFKLGMISWSVLSIIAFIGFMMERYPYTGDSNLILIGLVFVAVVLWGNVLFLLQGFILGLTVLLKRKSDVLDRSIVTAATIGVVLGIAGTAISLLLFFGW